MDGLKLDPDLSVPVPLMPDGVPNIAAALAVLVRSNVFPLEIVSEPLILNAPPDRFTVIVVPVMPKL